MKLFPSLFSVVCLLLNVAEGFAMNNLRFARADYQLVVQQQMSQWRARLLQRKMVEEDSEAKKRQRNRFRLFQKRFQNQN